MKVSLILLLSTLFIGSCATSPALRVQAPHIEVEEVSPDKWTAMTKQNLLHLTQVYDISPFLFTRKVRIEPSGIPHSHPVLTLNTRNAENPYLLLSVFLHEEFHWWLHIKPLPTQEGIKELKKIYPKAPVTLSYGKDTTYLHLIICYLEFRALEFYLGKVKAREVIKELMTKEKLYPWIYAKVLNQESVIKKIVDKHKLLPPPLN